MLKGTPAEEAALVAAQRGGHLDAAVAVYAVELVLVAHIPPLQGAFAPHAGLEGRLMRFWKKTGSLVFAGLYMERTASIPSVSRASLRVFWAALTSVSRRSLVFPSLFGPGSK